MTPPTTFRFARYEISDRTLEVSTSDLNLYYHALRIAEDHDSGGSYSMAAVLSLKKPYAFGLNALHSPAHLKDGNFPEMCGMHAELALWYATPSGKLRNGTVAVAGVSSKSRNQMSNTWPCVYCSALLTESGVKWIIFNSDGTVRKARL